MQTRLPYNVQANQSWEKVVAMFWLPGKQSLESEQIHYLKRFFILVVWVNPSHLYTLFMLKCVENAVIFINISLFFIGYWPCMSTNWLHLRKQHRPIVWNCFPGLALQIWFLVWEMLALKFYNIIYWLIWLRENKSLFN